MRIINSCPVANIRGPRISLSPDNYGTGGKTFDFRVFKPGKIPLEVSPIYAGMVAKEQSSSVEKFPLTSEFLERVEFGREEITNQNKVEALAKRFSGTMISTFHDNWLGEICLGRDLDPTRCMVFTYGRVRLTYFTPLPGLKTGKSHVFAISVHHCDAGDVIMGHGLLEHKKGADRLYFRYSIHDCVTVMTEDNTLLAAMINFRNMGYAKETLVLLMSAGMRGGLFADPISRFRFKIYSKDDYDDQKQLKPHIRKAFEFHEKAGFDAKGCFNMRQ